MLIRSRGGAPRLRPTAAIATALIAVGSLWWAMRSERPIHAQDSGPQAQAAPPPEAAKPVPAGPAHLLVDALKPVADQTDVYQVCGMSRPIEDAAPAWGRWVWLTGTRVDASSDGEDAPVYAARLPDGIAICAANRTEADRALQLRIRLPRGAYTVDRFIFLPSSPESEPRVEGLESAVLGATGTVAKSGTLPSGGVAIYRFVNRAGQADRAFREMKQQIRAARRSHSEACRRILAAIDECENNVAAIGRGIGQRNRYDVLRYVDRAILTLGHGQSICRNCQDDGRLGASGDAIRSAMDSVEDALSQLSAACLGLVPQMAAQKGADPDVREITVSLANGGARTLSFVKLGVVAPRGARTWPQEEATFGSLSPGESVRAAFKVRFSGDADLSGVTGSAAYLAGRTPVHLRMRSPWQPVVHEAARP